MKHALFDSDVRGQFAGHETFPLRLLWLKKVYDAVREGAPSGLFQDQSAIARFGVGRNMAVSMRYWALASGFIEENDRVLRPTPLGDLVLADHGLDPYVERSLTTWLTHWAIAGNPRSEHPVVPSLVKTSERPSKRSVWGVPRSRSDKFRCSISRSWRATTCRRLAANCMTPARDFGGARAATSREA